MTKTIVTLGLMFYSLARLLSIAYYTFHDMLTLPAAVYLITTACALICMALSAIFWMRRLSGKKLRMLLLFNAVCACINMLQVYFSPTIRSLSGWDMLITGTLFDVVFFLGCCTIKLRDTAYQPGRTPYARLGAANSRNRLAARNSQTESDKTGTTDSKEETP